MSEEPTERKQVFAGTIRKCPNCGAQITTDTAKCPACGFIIEKEKVSSSMEEFAKKFVSFQDESKKKDFVESYPVPNNKEDIRGFLNYAANQRDKDYATLKDKAFWTTVWNNKCRLIVNQAFDVFGTDSDFMQYLRDYKSGVEKSSGEVKKIRNRLLLGKIAKISVVAVLVLAIVGLFGMKSKKRADLIAGCTVPKENVKINPKYFEAISDAKIETTNISRRVVSSSHKAEPVWCLDTTVTVELKPIVDNEGLTAYERALKIVKNNRPEYYSSSAFKGVAWFRTIGDETYIECPYQSKSVTEHSFDNVHSAAEELLMAGKDNQYEKDKLKFTIRLTQIAGSRRECEDLAIKLHQSGEFSFTVTGFYEEYYAQWVRQQRLK
ncbi:MAG: zinc ribbon domain-containing protein [Treponema sp.]|nr:zinc ribbon domain-containing protein [Treponema sp.]